MQLRRHRGLCVKKGRRMKRDLLAHGQELLGVVLRDDALQHLVPDRRDHPILPVRVVLLEDDRQLVDPRSRSTLR